MPSDSPPEPPPEQPHTNRYSSPYVEKYELETYNPKTPLSQTLVGESSADEEEFFNTRSPVSNTREGITATPKRFLRQSRSTNGKVAYVVFSGHDVGVFYNWTAAALAISGLDFSSRVFKGYNSYEAAHSAWDGFTSTGRLPVDVASTLGSRSYPTPPVAPPPVTPQHQVPAYSILISPTPHRTHTPIKPAASPSYPNTSTSAQNDVREGGFRADQEDFWVVLTGTDPGVHQGRKAGEKAFGHFANPSFIRTRTRQEANQIFVDSYMELLVARHVD